MKTKLLYSFFFLFTLLTLNAQTATPPSIGNGTSATPYEISTLENLYWLTQNSTEWNKYYIQTENIDASSTITWDLNNGFTPIGNGITSFIGSYDGQGNTIDNLFINRPLEDYIGFIGYKSGPIKNLGLTNVNITGNNTVGGIIGYARGIVDNCYSSGTVVGNVGVGGLVGGIPDTKNGISTTRNSHSSCDVTGNKTVGGLAGSNGDVVNNCYSTGMVTGGTEGNIGGLIGSTWYGTINACYSESEVTSTGNNTGGLVGYNAQTQISNCYNTGSITGVSYVGGLVGIHSLYDIRNCYSTGSVSGSGSNIGGLVGNGAVESGGAYWGSHNSFWNTETSGQTISSGGIGVTTDEMHSLCTYINGVDASWDFVLEDLNGNSDVWGMNASVNNGYPYLTWQGFTHTEECCGFIDSIDTSVTTIGATITANDTDATYQWLDCDNNNAIIPGETAQTFTATTNGNYAVEITQNDCVGTSDCIPISTLSVEKFDNTTECSFYVYDNTLYFKNIQDLTKIKNIEIYNMLGQKVFKTSKINNEVSLRTLPIGIYVLKVNNLNSNSQTLRFLSN